MTTFKITAKWLLSGNAVFTVHNATGTHYTYRILKKPSQREPGRHTFFLSLLTGPDNETNYNYVGVVESDLSIRLTKKSKYHPKALPVRVVNWALACIHVGKELPAGYGIDGAGRCGRCGRELTHPDGVSDDGYRHGYGPECWKTIQDQKAGVYAHA
jgi:hypothetical protein